MLTVLEIIKKTTEFFAARGLEHPRLNAELLVGHGLGLGRMQLYLQFERPLSEAELERIRPLVRRRGQREPLQYVLGETEFFGLKLKTDRRALIPRPETERLVELVVARYADTAPPARILDLGTGSGAIALALASRFTDAQVTGLDHSEDALALAAENAAATGLPSRVTWLQSDWYAGLPDGAAFELIVANPPYLSAEETAQTQPEVREHEPHLALTSGGPDGLADLRKILAGATQFLAAGGLIALETGIAQHPALCALAREAGFNQVESLPDLTGRDRYVIAHR
ncbi:peptide chain release factor N(5)-glutamine methyltransferase [Opitutus terrae]|uniref:Release factor glutamine methyltransferase n=1 Tax=Opitutus terrae (strain DSM 11246 / JCM 15787 / PB90-1) TaxID=452637 RepID=B1ZVA7_OPITP|nr:peptide chain release factor N(5)-glutamine methyltransferase [Opitutus terrae]ACB76774.1 protein-(glutamine-N5) methyltransferase, release factor-specific [Opitutus terrae PB90-1]